MPRDLRLYLLLIGLPALLLGLAGARLLMVEKDRAGRVRERLDALVAERAARAVRRHVADTEARLLQRVRETPPATLAADLRAWCETEPFARNVFIWQRDAGLLWPAPASATAEEAGFIARYAALFGPQAVWGADSDAAPQRAPMLRSGWLPWFEGQQLYLLGWTETQTPDIVAGVELEMAALFSRLPDVFAGLGETETAFALRDGNGAAHMAFGAGADARAFNLLPLAPELPHWALAWQGPPPATSAGPGFAALGASLLALLVASLFGGGALLVRDARRQRLDALRKTDFVSNVSHELRTPLTSIRMYAELLAEKRADTPEKEEKFLGIIVSESERLSRLVNNVLDFSRLEQGRKKFSSEHVELREFVSGVLDAARGGLANAGLQIRFHAPDETTAFVDRDALSQVLLNVLDNAAKYAASGKEVEVVLERERILVSDRGPGIAPSYAKKIFDKFYRADDRLTAAAGGCGLGLSIARMLMRGMGGDLVYTPRAGGGSCFEIRLRAKG